VTDRKGSVGLPADQAAFVARLNASSSSSIPKRVSSSAINCTRSSDEVIGAEQGLKCAGIRPPPVQYLVSELAFIDVEAIHIRNLKLTSSRRLQAANLLEYAIVVEINPDDCELGFRLLWLLFNANHAVSPQFRHAETLRVGNFLQQNLCSVALFFELFDSMADVRFDNVVAQDYADGIVASKIFSQAECLRDPTLSLLVRIIDVFQAKIAAIGQQSQKVTSILAPCHNEDFFDARVDQGLNGIIHHGLVIDRKQVFVRHSREGIQTAARTPRKDYALEQLSEPFPNESGLCMKLGYQYDLAFVFNLVINQPGFPMRHPLFLCHA